MSVCLFLDSCGYFAVQAKSVTEENMEEIIIAVPKKDFQCTAGKIQHVSDTYFHTK